MKPSLSQLRQIAITGAVAAVACYGNFQPRDSGTDEPDTTVDPCEGALVHGSTQLDVAAA